MTAIHWLIAGAILVLSEFIVPGFIIIFFGAGALVTGGLMLMFGLHPAAQIIIFSVTSVILLLTVRRYMPNIFGGREKRGELPEENKEFEGEPAKVTEDIPAGGRGKVLFHGSVWEATSATPHAKGDDVTVLSRKNILLTVE